MLFQVVPFLIRGLADDHYTKAFVKMVQWYLLAVRATSHTENSLLEMTRAGIRYLYGHHCF